MTQAIFGISGLVDRYRVFLIDAWGVLHDGRQLYPGVTDTLTTLKRAGREVIVLSNAARRHAEFKRELQKLGLEEDMYSAVTTSGELAWKAFDQQLQIIEHFGHRCYYQGPERSRDVAEGLGLNIVAQLGEAEFIFNTGAEGNHSDASAFESLLHEARKAGLPMVCVNPDQIAIRGGVPGISAGAIARRYEQLGTVSYFGKPHLPVYEACFALYPDVPREQFVMLGDGLETDIKGANNAGIDSIFLSSGIHAAELADTYSEDVKALFAHYQVRPTYWMKSMLEQRS